MSIVLSESILKALGIPLYYKGVWLTDTIVFDTPDAITESITLDETESITPEKIDSALAETGDKEPVVIDTIVSVDPKEPVCSWNSDILFLTCDQLDIERQAHNGDPSNMIAMIPTKKQQNILYKPYHMTYCALDNCNDHQELTFKLLDQNMNHIKPESIHFTITNDYK